MLKKETLDASLQTIVGSPVIIEHQNVTESNADELRCGVIAQAEYNEFDGWYYVTGIIWDEKAQELINKGWSVSCSYDYLAVNDAGGEENNIHYDKEFTQLNFTHLAIVNNPRYERANIVFNCKIDNADDQKGKWVTIKGNHIFIPDGKTLDEVIDEKWEQRTKSYKEAKEQQKDKPSKLSDIDKELLQQGNTYSFARLLVENYPKEAKEAGINSYVNDYKKIDFDKDNKEYILYYDNGDKAFFSTDFKCKGYKTYNSKENDMTLIDKLQELINSVKNNKENETMVENAKVDKRKLIDEVAGIMKSAGCDDEDIRTAIGKMEKIGYDDSEKSADNEKEEDKKADNEKEDDKKDDKKVDNEDEKDKKEAEDLKKDEKEDVENKCKNSVENSKDEGKEFFDKINAIYNSSKKVTEPAVEYESRQSRLEAGAEYFG